VNRLESPKDTPEGRTPEAPAADEQGAAGTPGAGMTPEVPHPADADAVEHGAGPADPTRAAVLHHAAPTHMDAHAELSDGDHGHAEPMLGPIDWPAWGFAALGVLAGGIVVLLFRVAVG
jgi:hypothetical protein